MADRRRDTEDLNQAAAVQNPAQASQAGAASDAGNAALQNAVPRNTTQNTAQTMAAGQSAGQGTAAALTDTASLLNTQQTEGNAANPAASGADAAAGLNAVSAQAARTAADNRMAYVDTSALRGYLDNWRNSASNQAAGRIDYATQQGVRDLARAQDDAEEQYQQQLRQIAVDEARARDNQALYNAATGNTGGIGSAQMDAIAASAMTNRQTVYSARTKLGTDTMRQVADLRAQGEYQKADALMNIASEYNSRLFALEQWTQEFNVGVNQFNAALDQWNAEMNFQLRQANLSAQQWQTQFNYNRQQDEKTWAWREDER
ncbi:MAG: hypothetical protein IJT94_09035, partial [Oscillibacter sp.]|nr:hypothetical protein [Oscillibacter sp.]